MKRFMFTCGLCTMAGVLLLGADTPDPNKAKPADTATKSVAVSAPTPSSAPVAPPAPATETAQPPKNDAAPPKTAVPVASNASSAEKPSLKFNFRDVPLDTVLDYLSEAGGFTVVREATVEGRVDIVSLQPLSKDEAVALLNTVLNGRGFAAIRNEKTLTIVKSEDAKQKDIPVRSGNDPSNVPKTGEMVTQVIPVRHADVTQLLENLKPLLPTYAVANANASSNAIVLTDTQTDVRRMIEIIKALDTSISTISDVKVFSLTYADAVDAASMINTLFQTTTSGQSGNNSNMRNFFRNMRNASSGGGTSGGGGGPGGMMGGPGGMMGGPGGMMGGPGGMMGGSTGSESAAIQAGARVQAVGDERTNSVIVTASSDTLPLIESVLHQIDIEGLPAAPMRVFPLNYADATEMAEVINDAFGQNAVGATNRQKTSTQTNSRSGGQARSGSSSTILAYAVADYRTNSVVVTAEDDVMEQVVHMVEKLEDNPAREQKVFIYKLKNADVENVAEVLQGMFSTSSSSSSAKKSSSSSSSKSSSSSNKSSSSNSSSSNRSSSSSSF